MYLFSEKLNHLLDRLDKQCMMHGSQSDTFQVGVHGPKVRPLLQPRRFSGYKYPFILC
jgi:hypothetical protein